MNGKTPDGVDLRELLRAQFAAAVLPAVVQSDELACYNPDYRDVPAAKRAVAYADALLAELEKP